MASSKTDDKKDHHAHAGDHAHAGPKLYWIFAVILCAITFVEWLVFDRRIAWGITGTAMVVGLVLLSLIKFAMVCGWYMHLRFDNKMLTQIFVFSALLAMGVFLILQLSLPGVTN